MGLKMDCNEFKFSRSQYFQNATPSHPLGRFNSLKPRDIIEQVRTSF